MEKNNKNIKNEVVDVEKIEDLKEPVIKEETVSEKPMIAKKKTSAKKKTTTKKKTVKSKKSNESLTKAKAPKTNTDSTVSEELRKVTNIMSKEQLKRPKKIALMVSISVLMVISIAVFVIIQFDRFKIVEVVKNETDKTIEATGTTEFIEILETYEIDEIKNEKTDVPEIEIKTSINKKDETEKETETTKKEIETTKEEKETTKKETEATKKETEASKKEIETTKKETETSKKETVKSQTKETISVKILDKAQSKKSVQETINENTPMLLRIIPKYNTELYSKATYYQYDIEDVKQAFTQLSSYYNSVQNKVFGDVDLDIKGINGKLYLNYMNMKNYIDSYVENDKIKYATLVDVQTTDIPVSFDFTLAKDMGMYYEIPANDGNNRLNLMVLKGTKIGFSESFALMTTLEILDIEWYTKHNPYFDIEDVVGENPKVRTTFTEPLFKIEEMLQNAKFNRIRYDKKGYITDIFHFQ